MVLSPQRGHLTCCRAGHGAVPPPLPLILQVTVVAEKMLSVWLWCIVLLESGQDCLATGKAPESRQKLVKSCLLPFPTCVCSKLTARKV